MATTIKLKNSVTTTNAPSSLVQGEVAINITDKKVWVGNAATTPIQLLGDGGSASFTSIAFGAGTVSNPSITFTGDTNTGIYSPAADTIAFTEGGAESMRIDSSGNVGIGTSSPGRKLHVNGDIRTVNCLIEDSGTNVNFGTFTAGYLGLQANGSERMRIDSSGNVGIGTSSPSFAVDVVRSSGDAQLRLMSQATGTNGIIFRNNAAPTSGKGAILYPNGSSASGADTMQFVVDNAERMRITSGGDLLVGKTSTSYTVAGCRLLSIGIAEFTSDGNQGININRLTNDGNLIEFYQANNLEGTISVSGSTVSYNGGHLSRWSQLPNAQKDNTLLKGTVMSNLDDMCVWIKDGEVLPNEQLNKMKVSDVEGDTNVAGVFVNWTFDEQCQSDDMNVAMTGDMIIRIAQGIVVQKGDLLMSAGDGTAKPQGDDIRRNKTVAKVTSNHVTCTYEDGSYCVPCVLMAC